MFPTVTGRFSMQPSGLVQGQFVDQMSEDVSGYINRMRRNPLLSAAGGLGMGMALASWSCDAIHFDAHPANN